MASARGRGMPAVSNVILPQPYQTLSEERVRFSAAMAFDAAVECLLTPGRSLIQVTTEDSR